MIRFRRSKSFAFVLMLALFAGACSGLQPYILTGTQPGSAGQINRPPTLTPFRPVRNTAEATLTAALATATSTPLPSREPQPTPTKWIQASPTQANTPPAAPRLTLSLDPNLPPALAAALQLPPELGLAGPEETAPDLFLGPGGDAPLSAWVYALVTPFPALQEDVSAQALSNTWQGRPEGPFAGRPLWMSPGTLAMFSALWGPPAPGLVQTAAEAELVHSAWDNRPAWALVPFEDLEPRWKVLAVDGQSPIHKDFNPQVYPLRVPVSLSGEPKLVAAVAGLYGPASETPLLPASNRDPGRMTTLAMTGVTALVRATAFSMEQQGLLYPGRDIGDWLREADLTHISNEVPFAEGCPYPNPVQPDMRFCSDPRYIALLEDVGTDIVELTGDHFQDWGNAAMLYTLQMYRDRDWPYYGGGKDQDEARQAVLVEHNGNRLAFIGCNAKGGGFAQAGPEHPGAVVCGDWMPTEIARLRSEGYLPIATFQHFEYYTYKAQPDQVRDFRTMADAGAVIVSGSQAHQPQALEFYNGVLIHYGLGNLFFDQYDVSLATRQGFIDRHVFYNGRYISTELLPILFEDYARARPMNADEKAELYQAVFGASGW